MKLATGVDLVEIARVEAAIERHGERILRRVFTTRELSDAAGHMGSLSARFAAKEAVAKALGTGIGDIQWQEIEVLRGPNRQPSLHLYGSAAELAARLELTTWSISLSHTQVYAIAMVTAISQ